MGDPRKHRKKYTTPMHPWQKERLDAEREIRTKYGTRNKKEIWKMNSKLKSFFVGAKKANSAKSEQDKLEAEQLLTRVRKLGLIAETQGADAILDLQLASIMERRLQTIVLKKGLARTAKQARQFITHEHILIGNKKITSPSYLVTLEEEGLISFDHKSAFNDPMHPERAKAEGEDAKKLKEIKKEEKVEEKQPETKEVEKEKAAPKAAA